MQNKPVTYLQKGEANIEARLRLEKLLSEMMDCSVLHNDIGVLCYEMGEMNEALKHFRAAAAIDETNILAQKNYADMLSSLGQHQAAANIYEEILRTADDDAECWLSLATIRSLTGHREAAEYCLRRALKLAPELDQAKQMLASLSQTSQSEMKGPAAQGAELQTTRLSESDYQAQLQAEINTYKQNVNVHDLPAINHELNNAVLSPLLEELTGEGDYLRWWANEMKSLAASLNRPVRALSIGCGNGDVEIDLIKRAGSPYNLYLIGIDINPHMVQRGNAMAKQQGLANVEFKVGDFNALHLDGGFDIVIANHALHHVVELERLFSVVNAHATDEMMFLVNDMIGRNGHVMWENTEKVVGALWDSIDEKFKLNWHTRTYDREPQNHDFSNEGFEGIRAQDILPLLNETFDVDLFLPFYAFVNRFVERAYGHNYDVKNPEDVQLARELMSLDIRLLSEKKLSPAQAFMRLRKKGRGEVLRYQFQTPDEAIAARTTEIELQDCMATYFYAEGVGSSADRDEIFREVFG